MYCFSTSGTSAIRPSSSVFLLATAKKYEGPTVCKHHSLLLRLRGSCLSRIHKVLGSFSIAEPTTTMAFTISGCVAFTADNTGDPNWKCDITIPNSSSDILNACVRYQAYVKAPETWSTNSKKVATVVKLK